MGDGEVEFGRFAFGELLGEMEMCGVCFGDDEAARGVFVEAVNDTRTDVVFVVTAAELAAGVVEESVDERAVRVSIGGVDDELGGFVDDEEVFVFKKDVERDVLRDGRKRRGGFGKMKGDVVA